MRLTYGFSVEPKGHTPKLFRQVHGRAVVEVKDAAHAEALRASPPEADAAFTRAVGVELSAFSADCVPLLFYGTDPGDPVAAVHSGWRGSAQGVGPATLAAMALPMERAHLVMGPCIRGCCFAVREDFVDAFRSHGHDVDRWLERRGDRWHFHLDRFLLEDQFPGIANERRHLAALRCTVCSRPTLPSFRRDRDTDPTIRAHIRRLSASGPSA